MAGVIIGKSGQNIRRIRMDTGADVDLDDAGGGHNDRIITIQGTPEQITNAQYMLQMRFVLLLSSTPVHGQSPVARL